MAQWLKNLPVNAGDMGWVPDPRRCHMPPSNLGQNYSHVPYSLHKRGSMLSCAQLFATPWTGSFVHGIILSRILECVPISFSRASSQPRDWTQASCNSCTGRQILHLCTTWEAPQQQKPLQWDAQAPQTRVAPLTTARESWWSNEGPAQPNIIKKKETKITS